MTQRRSSTCSVDRPEPDDMSSAASEATSSHHTSHRHSIDGRMTGKHAGQSLPTGSFEWNSEDVRPAGRCQLLPADRTREWAGYAAIGNGPPTWYPVVNPVGDRNPCPGGPPAGTCRLFENRRPRPESNAHRADHPAPPKDAWTLRCGPEYTRAFPPPRIDLAATISLNAGLLTCRAKPEVFA